MQVCSWALNGEYGGTVLRADSKSAIVDYDSAVYALRIVEDDKDENQ